MLNVNKFEVGELENLGGIFQTGLMGTTIHITYVSKPMHFRLFQLLL